MSIASYIKQSTCIGSRTTRISSNMKQYDLSDDRIVLVKKSQGQHTVIVKQNDSDVKCVEFTPHR